MGGSGKDGHVSWSSHSPRGPRMSEDIRRSTPSLRPAPLPDRWLRVLLRSPKVCGCRRAPESAVMPFSYSWSWSCLLSPLPRAQTSELAAAFALAGFLSSLNVPLLCLSAVLLTCVPTLWPSRSQSCTRVLCELFSVAISLPWLVAFDMPE